MEVKVGRIYKHFKGDFYLVEGVATSADDLEECVIYRQLYGDGNLFIRKSSEFLGKVDKDKYPDVEQEYRFEPQDIKSKRLVKS